MSIPSGSPQTYLVHKIVLVLEGQSIESVLTQMGDKGWVAWWMDHAPRGEPRIYFQRECVRFV